VHAVSEKKSGDTKGSCHEQLEKVFDNFAKYVSYENPEKRF
jgi:hypothetical protein